jgi:hypothetical protein
MSEGTQSRQTKIFLYVIGALVLLLIVMYIWKGVAVSQADKRFEKERAELAAQREELEESMRVATAERVEEMLRLMGMPLGWAVRTEAIAEDYDQIEEYAARLVKEPRIRRVVVVTAEGDIRISTDRKLQGEPASTFFGELASKGDITLQKSDSGEYDLIVPILGYTGRLGSVIVTVEGE